MIVTLAFEIESSCLWHFTPEGENIGELKGQDLGVSEALRQDIERWRNDADVRSPINPHDWISHIECTRRGFDLALRLAFELEGRLTVGFAGKERDSAGAIRWFFLVIKALGHQRW